MRNSLYDPQRHTRRFSRSPGAPIDRSRCCVSVWSNDSHSRSQCSRKGRYEHDGRMYCKQHHPDTLAAKEAEDTARREAQAAQWRYSRKLKDWQAAGAVLIEAIAAGHNDPRQAAREYLEAKPVLNPLPTSGDME